MNKKMQKNNKKTLIADDNIINVEKDSAVVTSKNDDKKVKNKTQKQLKKERKKQIRLKVKQIIKENKQKEQALAKEREQTIRDLQKQGKIATWFKLDNAGSIYPSAIQKNWNFVYRISATFKEKINVEQLQKALDDIIPRFPTFNVKLCHGFFWNYYEPNFSRLVVERETDFPCQPFDLNDREGFLIRILYSDHKIMLEAFHAIADGRGALFFFNSLVARYLERLGVVISTYVGCANYLDVPNDEESEDAFFRYVNDQKTKRPKERPAYKIKGSVLPDGVVNTLEAHMSVNNIKEVARAHNASISEYLSSAVAYAIYQEAKNAKKPVRVSIPCDLRPRFESKTLRNFSSYKNVEVVGEDLSFEDILSQFKTQFSEIDNDFFQSNINANVKIQKNFFIKIFPFFIKNIALKLSFNYLGENCQTLAFSNIGRVNVPKEFEDYIDYYSVNLGRSLHNQKSIGVISFGDKMVMSISSKIKENNTEKALFKFLADDGIKIKLYSNRRDLYGTRKEV